MGFGPDAFASVPTQREYDAVIRSIVVFESARLLKLGGVLALNVDNTATPHSIPG